MICDNELMKKKVTVLYICPDPTLGGSTQSLLDMIESLRGLVKPIVLFGREDSAFELFHNRGIECVVYPFIRLHFFSQTSSFMEILRHPRRIRIINLHCVEKACVKKVKEYLGSRSIDIVHSNYSSILIGHELSVALKAKHVWHIREFLDPGVHVPNRPFGGYTLLKFLINRADARIVISHQAQAHWGFKQKNTWIIYDAVAKASDSGYCSEKKPYILFCSYHITEAKGAIIVVKAFGISGLNKDGIRLSFVGNCTDEMHSQIMGIAKKYECADSIDFIPCQEDVKPFFMNAKAFIMASVNEGLGRVTAEAMFYGCPVIAKDSGGTKDLISDQQTGYLFRTEDECASLMRQVCFSSQEDLIKRAQDFAVSNLSVEVYGPRIMEVYNSVLS